MELCSVPRVRVGWLPPRLEHKLQEEPISLHVRAPMAATSRMMAHAESATTAAWPALVQQHQNARHVHPLEQVRWSDQDSTVARVLLLRLMRLMSRSARLQTALFCLLGVLLVQLSAWLVLLLMDLFLNRQQDSVFVRAGQNWLEPRVKLAQQGAKNVMLMVAWEDVSIMPSLTAHHANVFPSTILTLLQTCADNVQLVTVQPVLPMVPALHVLLQRYLCSPNVSAQPATTQSQPLIQRNVLPAVRTVAPVLF